MLPVVTLIFNSRAKTRSCWGGSLLLGNQLGIGPARHRSQVNAPFSRSLSNCPSGSALPPIEARKGNLEVPAGVQPGATTFCSLLVLLCNLTRPWLKYTLEGFMVQMTAASDIEKATR